MFGIKKIHRYVFKEHLFPFLGALFVFSFIFLVQYLISQIDKLVGKNLGFMVISEFMILSLAPIFAEVVPVAGHRESISQRSWYLPCYLLPLFVSACFITTTISFRMRITNTSC
jgi:hypothetical protein